MEERVGSRKTEVGRRKTEVGRRKSEVGSRKTEVGRRKTEDRSQKSKDANLSSASDFGFSLLTPDFGLQTSVLSQKVTEKRFKWFPDLLFLA
jgi:hypothetical protein